MNVDDKVLHRLQELIDRGRKIEENKKQSRSGDPRIDPQAARQWHASTKNILGKALGRDSEHYVLFDKHCSGEMMHHTLLRGMGILSAAKEDWERGYIKDIRNLVAAEMFSDFLDQASELLAAGYYGPAAVLAGAVLEDNLRKMCVKHSIDTSDQPKVEYMNAQLAKLGIYNKLTQKKLIAIADIRNSAAHGKWNEFKPEDVEDMIKWVISFSEEHLG